MKALSCRPKARLLNETASSQVHLSRRPCFTCHRVSPFINRRDKRQLAAQAVHDESKSKDASDKPSEVSNVRPDASSSAEDDVEAVLRDAFQQMKKQAMSSLDAESAQIMENMQYEDVVDPDTFFRKIADQLLGPVLNALGITEEPHEFMKDLLKIVIALQLVTAGALFYSCEFGLHYDSGDSFRAVSGLFLGYVTRLSIKTEQLLWPLYELVAKFLPLENKGVEMLGITPAPREEIIKTLNRMAITVAVVFFVPQALLHWGVDESVQLAVPMALGWFLLDIVFLAAVLFKLQRF